MIRTYSSNRMKDALLNLAVVALYLLLAKAGLFFSLKNTTITIFWPAGGFALAVLLLGGLKYLPGILLGAVFAGFMAVSHPFLAILLGVADAAESYLAYWLLTHKLKFNVALETRQDFFKLTLLAAGLASAASALIASTAMLLLGEIPANLFREIALRWWMGDVLGIAFITPFILVWKNLPQGFLKPSHLIECMLVFVCAFLFGQSLFFGWLHGYQYVPHSVSWIILLIVWSALRFGRHHTSALQLLVFFQALWSISEGANAFVQQRAQGDLADFWLFGMAIAVGGMALSIIAMESKKTQKLLKEGEDRLRLALSVSNQGWFDVNLRSREMKLCDDCAKLMGNHLEAACSDYAVWKIFIHPDDLDAVINAFNECIATGESKVVEYRFHAHKGDWIWISSAAKVTEWDESGQALRLIGTHTNISARKQIENELIEQKEFFRVITENSLDFIAVLDLQGRRIYNNQAYTRIFGDVKSLEGTDSFAEIHPDDRERLQNVFKNTIQSGQGQKAEFRFLLANGAVRYMESSGALIRNSKGEPASVMVVSHDITERKRVEQEIQLLAFYDQLTHLPNRRLLTDRLTQTMASSRRSGCYCALMFLDLDNFKPLNDVHGHPVGDMLLIEVAERLKKCVREVDTVSRFGGDEFVVVLNELDEDWARSKSQAASVADKICTSLAKPYLLTIKHEGRADAVIEHHCTASVGVVLFVNHEFDQEDIIKRADAAMYEAKASGRNQVRFFHVEAAS
ncbi:MAG: diguanylate cyclase [Methylotenera sp.]|nr:diguanylate cyclase [Methylotenera sp.]